MSAMSGDAPASGTPPAILLMGPTATGKTGLALELARRFPVGVISVDSALVYRGMDIGTAKPAPWQLAACPHELVNIRDPSERYSAGDFRRDALAAMERIEAAGKVPLLVGGTMLYFRALRQGLAPLPGADMRLRAELDAEAARLGWPAMHSKLAAVDPQAAARIHPHDAQRIQRGLEVQARMGRSLSELQAAGTASSPRSRAFLAVGLVPPDREKLNQRLEKRLNNMMENGFLNEVRGLFERGDLDPGLPALRAVGYRQLWQHLAGECALDEARRRALVATRRLAKRQMTWLRSEPLDVRLDPDAPDVAAKIVDVFAAALGHHGESL